MLQDIKQALRKRLYGQWLYLCAEGWDSHQSRFCDPPLPTGIEGLPVVRFHDLRHAAVYALRKGGCDAKDIQAWLGHSDITTTLNVYGHVLNGDMDQLGQVMDKLLF